MAKLSQIQKTQKIREFMDLLVTASGRLLRDVPDAVELLEQGLEIGPNDFAEAAVRLLVARKDVGNE